MKPPVKKAMPDMMNCPHCAKMSTGSGTCPECGKPMAKGMPKGKPAAAASNAGPPPSYMKGAFSVLGGS